MEREKFTEIEKKQLIIFFAIAFGFTYLMGFAMAYASKIGIPVEVFVNAQMMYPAVGAIIAMLITKRDDPNLPKKFYLSVVVFTVLLVLAVLGRLFIEFDIILVINIIISAGSFISIILYFIEKKYRRFAYSLTSMKKNKGYIFILLFLVLYFIRLFIPIIAGLDTWDSLKPTTQGIIMTVLIPVNFFFVMLPFFGEEYGWRSFLQPLLQKRYGNYLGILLLGFLWGIWHLPVNILFYSPETWGYSVLNQIIVCVGYSVFFGYVYMKTNNIWLAVWMHYLNNNLILLFVDPSAIQNQILDLISVLMVLAMFVVLYLPFIFAPTFRKVSLEPMPLEVPVELLQAERKVKENENEESVFSDEDRGEDQ